MRLLVVVAVGAATFGAAFACTGEDPVLAPSGDAGAMLADATADDGRAPAVDVPDAAPDGPGRPAFCAGKAALLCMDFEDGDATPSPWHTPGLQYPLLRAAAEAGYESALGLEAVALVRKNEAKAGAWMAGDFVFEKERVILSARLRLTAIATAGRVDVLAIEMNAALAGARARIALSVLGSSSRFDYRNASGIAMTTPELTLEVGRWYAVRIVVAKDAGGLLEVEPGAAQEVGTQPWPSGSSKRVELGAFVQLATTDMQTPTVQLDDVLLVEE